MVVVAIIFWVVIALALLGLAIHVVSIIKGKAPDKSGSLPGPIRKALGRWL